MKKIRIYSLIIFTVLFLQSCKLWPYRSDFDCPVPDGYKCKSLYEVNNLVDSGKFEEKPVRQVNRKDNQGCQCLKINKKAK